jgi:hypothetical protein
LFVLLFIQCIQEYSAIVIHKCLKTVFIQVQRFLKQILFQLLKNKMNLNLEIASECQLTAHTNDVRIYNTYIFAIYLLQNILDVCTIHTSFTNYQIKIMILIKSIWVGPIYLPTMLMTR